MSEGISWRLTHRTLSNLQPTEIVDDGCSVHLAVLMTCGFISKCKCDEISPIKRNKIVE